MGVEELFGVPKKAEIEMMVGKKTFSFPILKGKELAKLLESGKNVTLKVEDIEKFVLMILRENYDNVSITDVQNVSFKDKMTLVNKLFELNGFPTQNNSFLSQSPATAGVTLKR